MVMLIDLGEEHGELAEQELEHEPGLSAAGRRALALLACAGLLLVTVAAAAPPQPGLMSGPIRIPGASSSVAFTGDFMMTLGDGAGGVVDLIAVGTDDGLPRWRVPLPDGAQQVYGAWQFKDVLLVSLMNNVYVDQTRTIYAMDRRTGAIRWRSPSTYLGTVAADGSLLTVEFGPAKEEKSFVAREPETGRELWRLPFEQTQDWSLYQVGDQVAAVLLLGREHDRVSLVDPTTGRTAYQAELPATSSDIIQQATGELLIPYGPPGGRRLRALSLPGLTMLWDVVHPATRVPSYAFDCRPAICLDDGQQMWVLDSTDGRVRWHSELNGYFAAAPGLLFVGLDDARPTYSTLRDVWTGEVLLPLGRWRVLGYDGTSLLMVIQGWDRTWFGSIDLKKPRSGVKLLGSGGLSIAACWLGDGTVACRALGGGVDVYRYRPPLSSPEQAGAGAVRAADA